MDMVADTHLHSNHSHDGCDHLALVCEEAIGKGLKALCTTEHIFLDPRDVGYGYFDIDNYLQAIEACQKRYKGQLMVLAGVEFSETHLFSDVLKDLDRYPLDMIVGALHWLEVGFFGDPKVVASYRKDDLMDRYYKRLYEMVVAGGFDTLAHMDLIKRYVSVDEKVVTDPMIKVLKSLVQQGIALELNTSTIRRDHLETAASYALVDAYLELGGRRLTLGSDAHRKEDIAGGFEQVPSKYLPYMGVFQKRIFVGFESLK